MQSFWFSLWSLLYNLQTVLFTLQFIVQCSMQSVFKSCGLYLSIVFILQFIFCSLYSVLVSLQSIVYNFQTSVFSLYSGLYSNVQKRPGQIALCGNGSSHGGGRGLMVAGPELEIGGGNRPAIVKCIYLPGPQPKTMYISKQSWIWDVCI